MINSAQNTRSTWSERKPLRVVTIGQLLFKSFVPVERKAGSRQIRLYNRILQNKSRFETENAAKNILMQISFP